MSYSRHLKVPENTTRLAANNTPVANLRGTGIAVHLRKLELGLGADSGGERRVSNHVAESLSIDDQNELEKPTKRNTSTRFNGHRERVGTGTCLSASCSAKTLRFVWSRIMRVLMKQPRSSFFARNIDILRRG